MNADDKIRAILHAEADAVDPSPAGWDAINEGVAARRARRWWTRGAALAGAAAVFLGATAYVATLDRTRSAIEGVPASPGVETGTPRPSTTPATTPTPGGGGAPAARAATGAIWPLTTTAEVEAWQRDPESMPALRSSTGAALAFARHYLGVPDATIEGDDAYGESRVTVRDAARNGAVISFLTVRGLGRDGTAPFSVTQAGAGMLSVFTPEAGDALTRNVRVEGSFEADAQPEIRVRVRGDGPGLQADAGEVVANSKLGPGTFLATLRLGPMPATGSVLVEVVHDGVVASQAAVAVSFRQDAGPQAFVAAREGRIGVFAVTTGEVVRWLTDGDPGAGASEPELSDDGKSVVYVQSTGTCASEIRAVPTAGGSPVTLVTGEGRLAHPSRQGGVLAYRRIGCEQGGDRMDLVVRDGGKVVLEAPGHLLGGPVVQAGVVAYVAQVGIEGVVRTYDTRRGNDRDHAAAPAGCSWTSVAWREADLAGLAACGTGRDAEARVYLLAAVARGPVTTVAVGGAYSLDFAGEHAILGVPVLRRPYEVWTVVDGYAARVPGTATRPTWG